MQLSRGVAHFPGGTLFITDSSGRRFSRKNQSTESSAVCVENFRERQDDLYGTCYVPHDPRVRRYGLSAFLVRPLRELDCSKCRSLQLQLEHYLNIARTIWTGCFMMMLLVKLFRFKTDPCFLRVFLFHLSEVGKCPSYPSTSPRAMKFFFLTSNALEMQCHTAPSSRYRMPHCKTYGARVRLRSDLREFTDNRHLARESNLVLQVSISSGYSKYLIVHLFQTGRKGTLVRTNNSFIVHQDWNGLNTLEALLNNIDLIIFEMFFCQDWFSQFLEHVLMPMLHFTWCHNC